MIPEKIPEIKNENKKNLLEKDLETYKDIINDREKLFDYDLEQIRQSIKQNSGDEQENQATTKLRTLEFMRVNLETHNRLVLHYALELIKKMKLSQKDKAIAKIAVILHDAGKLAAPLLEHHTKGMEYAGIILKKYYNKSIAGIKINQTFCQKVLEAINRHMNHPYLVMMNKARFPEPQDNVDKIVFDADMLANTGFKNVAFRFGDPANLSIDIRAAEEKSKNNQKTCVLQECFENVLAGVRNIEKTILLEESGETLAQALRDIEKIYKFLISERDENLKKGLLWPTKNPEDNFQPIEGDNILEQVQNLFSENNKFSTLTILDKGNEKTSGQVLIKKILNGQIMKAAKACGVDEKFAEYLKM